MTKKHGHEDEHCLHACDHCDVAYCCDCNREWGTCKQTHYWYFPQYTPTYTKPYYGTTTIHGAVTFGTSTMVGHTHEHEN